MADGFVAFLLSQHNCQSAVGAPSEQYLATWRAMAAAGWPVIRHGNLRLVRLDDYVRFLEERAKAAPKSATAELEKRLGIVEVSNG
jgi:hypothetical protein